MTSPRLLTKEEKDNIINLHASGKTLKQIIKISGRSIRAVKRALVNNRTPRKKKTNIEAMLGLFKEGKSASEIAAIFNVDVSVIRHSLKRRSISSRTLEFSCEDRRDEIIDLIVKGETQSEICYKLGIPSNTLNHFIKRHKLDDTVLKNFRYSSSLPERELLSWLEPYSPIHKYKYNNRKEIDIYLPEFNLGIEYCGLYWHRESFRGKSLHVEKMRECKSLNITLLTIFDYEWELHKDIVKSVILSKINKAKRTVFGRKCDVRVLSNKECFSFFNNNHLQGAPPSILLGVGLTYEDEIIAALSFGKHHRQNNIYLLNRLAFLQNVKIIGGSSKMFKFAVTKLKELGISEVTTYSDNRWSSGNVYNKMGFVLDKELPIDYFYVKSKKIYSKQSLKKTNAEKLTDETEYDLRLAQGYDRVWDCGKKRWIFKID